MARKLRILLLALIFIGAVSYIVIRGIHSRVQASEAIKGKTLDQAVPSVAVIHAKRGDPKEELVLPGSIQAFSDSPVYARTSGYLKKWYFDIGSRVSTGDLLAEIESPEVEHQLAQARADLGTAQANLKLAETTMIRYQGLLKLNSISRQETENAAGAYEADQAIIASQTANVKRLEQMVAFEKVYAPFDGIITARNTDVGQLINSGNGGAAQELFHVASASKLRIFLNVPQSYAHVIVPGSNAQIILPESPGHPYLGKVSRNSGAIDAATRTLLTEVDIDNVSGQLMPGAYAEVHLRLPAVTAALIVPVNALIFRAEGLQLAVIRHGNRAEFVHVTQGRDFGNEVEITSGITAGDLVIINTPDSLTSGETVRVEPDKGLPPGQPR